EGDDRVEGARAAAELDRQVKLAPDGSGVVGEGADVRSARAGLGPQVHALQRRDRRAAVDVAAGHVARVVGDDADDLLAVGVLEDRIDESGVRARALAEACADGALAAAPTVVPAAPIAALAGH